MVRIEVGEATDPLPRARRRRDALLAASDWTQQPDNRLTAEQRAAWAAVRAEWRAVIDDLKAGLSPRPWASPPTF